MRPMNKNNKMEGKSFKTFVILKKMKAKIFTTRKQNEWIFQPFFHTYQEKATIFLLPCKMPK